jgi:hypothetical protein
MSCIAVTTSNSCTVSVLELISLQATVMWCRVNTDVSIKTGMPWLTRHDPIPTQTNIAIFGWQSCNWHNLVECYLLLFRAVTKLIGPFKLPIQHVSTKGFSADADLPDYCHPYSPCVCKAELSPMLDVKIWSVHGSENWFCGALKCDAGWWSDKWLPIFRGIWPYRKSTQNNMVVRPTKHRYTRIWRPHMIS